MSDQRIDADQTDLTRAKEMTRKVFQSIFPVLLLIALLAIADFLVFWQ